MTMQMEIVNSLGTETTIGRARKALSQQGFNESNEVIFDLMRKVGFIKVPIKNSRIYNRQSALAISAAEATKGENMSFDTTTIENMSFDTTTIENMSFDTTTIENGISVPTIDKHYVAWGFFKDLKKIISSDNFFSVFIAGPSGNGKTVMVEQACANAGRKFIRTQISMETDEGDLIGGYRLQDGDTVFVDGPVVRAMREGAVLLLDEIDRATNKILCLQGIGEGKPFMIKKTGETIAPAPGFQIIATANTKGQGDSNGKFTGAFIIDEAFLERFIITVNQPFATKACEVKILMAHLKMFGLPRNKPLASLLVDWSIQIRQLYDENGINELVSTRRLCHIIQTYSVFSDIKKSVRLCLNRFEDDNAKAMFELFENMKPEDLGVDTQKTPQDLLDEALTEVL